MSVSINAPEAAEAPRTPQAGAELAAAITRKIHEIGGVTVYDLRVLVEDGQVVLGGQCSGHAVRERIGSVARDVPGCGDVVNRIEVFDITA